MTENKKSKWTAFVIDVEADGPIPGDFSMTEIGAVKLTRNLDSYFYAGLYPMSFFSNRGALDSINKKREELWVSAMDPLEAMLDFSIWINENTNPGTHPMFFSDNNGFDFAFVNWYFVHCKLNNPFGHTSRNIADIYGGLTGDLSKSFQFKKLRDTKHTHHPVDDAKGNAEALIKMIDRFGLKGLNIDA